MCWNVAIISGPTATGKTSVAISLAKRIVDAGYECIVVNFDSLLFYKELNVGTAKPSLKEMCGIKHDLINIESAKNPVNVSVYKAVATKVVNDHLQNGRKVLLVGGSGFYLRALVKGMYESLTTSASVKHEVADILRRDGIDGLLLILEKNDLPSYQRLHRNDEYRIVRAVEHFLTNGTPFSEQKQKMDESEPYNYLKTVHQEWKVKHIHLDVPKAEHIKIIEERTRSMMENGLFAEVEQLLESGFSGREKPLQSIGYKESVSFLQECSEIIDEDSCYNNIVVATRQLAKSQRTWFNRSLNRQQYNSLESDVVSQIYNFLFSER